MGFSISWVAFQGLPLAKAALTFGLIQSGQSDEIFDFAYNGAEIGKDWSIVIFNDVDMDLVDDRRMASLSVGRDMVVVHNIDTVMLQWAEQWRDGHEVWSIRHTSAEGARNLETTGNLPACFEEIRRARFADQDREDAGAASVDFIAEIPIEVAECVTGFRHDTIDVEFLELVPISGDSK